MTIYKQMSMALFQETVFLWVLEISISCIFLCVMKCYSSFEFFQLFKNEKAILSS